MKSRFYCILTCFAFLMLPSCRSTVHSEAELLKELAGNDAMYGSKIIGDIKIEFKYIPSEVFAYRALEKDSAIRVDSVLAKHAESLTFVMVLKGINNLEGVDMIRHNIDGKQAYKDRIQYLNFGITDAFELDAEGVIQKPLLMSFENTYGLSKNMVFNIIFKKPKAKQFTIAYQDNLFATGKSKFNFNTKELIQIPNCEYTK